MDNEIDRTVRQAAFAAWQRVLDVDSPAPDDDFFELGGHSLSAMRIISMVRRDIASDVGVSVLLTNPEFDQFVRRVTEHVAAAD